MVKETHDLDWNTVPDYHRQVFQSPLGEVVKETGEYVEEARRRGFEFQSPLGEVVKETYYPLTSLHLSKSFNPLSGKW